MKKFLLSLLIGAGILAAGFIGYQNPKSNFGAVSIPDAPYSFITTLQSGIAKSDTTMTLAGGTLKDGTALTGYQCFTLDAGTAVAEYTCGTASGTAISGLLRGINPLNPAATSTALSFAHRRGADVRITDFPIVQVLKRLNNGQDSYPIPLKYDSSISTTTIAASNGNLASVGYVNTVSLQGGPTATTTIPGVVQIGTTAQIVAGTGMTGNYTLVPAGSLFNRTWSSTTIIPVTNATGTLDTRFIDQSANYTWSGTHNFTATTTFATSTFNGLVTFNGGASLGSLSFSAATSTTPSGNATTTSTFITGFQPKTITVYYKLQGSNTGTAWYSAGVAVFNGTTLISNIITYSNLAASTALTAHTNLNPDPVSTYPIVDANSDDVDLRIGSVTSTGFTVTTHHYGSSNGVNAQFTVVASE